MKTRRHLFIVIGLSLLVLLSGCDMSEVGSIGLKNDLTYVINGYGQGLVHNSVEEAMSHISHRYHDSNGVDYGERWIQVAVALTAGDYLAYDVELDYWRSYGDQAVAVGELTTVYRLGTNPVITKTETKEWTFIKENGRWKIKSERAR